MMTATVFVVASAFSASIVNVASSDCVIRVAGKPSGLSNADNGRELHQGEVILCKKSANAKAIGVTYKIGSSVLTANMDGVPERINTDSVDSSFRRSGIEALATGSPNLAKLAKGDFAVRNTRASSMTKLMMQAIGGGSKTAIGLDMHQNPVGKNQTAIMRTPGTPDSCNVDLTAHFGDGTSKTQKNVDVCSVREVQF